MSLKWTINNYFVANSLNYIDTIINNASFNELRIIEDIINHYNLDNSYKDKLNNRKVKIEEENDLYSNITRDIFICHSSKDKELLSKIVNYLENNEGYNTWYSERNMPWNPINYWDNIKEAIKNCKVFLLLITENSKHSIDVRKELTICKELNILNRVALISDTTNPGIEIRQFLSETGSEWIDIKSDNALEILSKRIYDLKDRVIKKNEDNFDNAAYINIFLNRAEKLINQKKYTEAKDKIEEVLDINPNNAKAYLLLCLIDLGLTSEIDLEKQVKPLNSNKNFKMALSFAKDDYKQTLLNYQNKVNYRIEQKRIESIYHNGIDLMNKKQYDKAIKIFNTILDYKDSKEKIVSCTNDINQSIYDEACEKLDNKQYDEAINLFNKIEGFKDSLNKKEYALNVKKELEEKYNEAIFIFNNNEYQEALTLFNTIKDYRDSNKYINQCNELIKKEEKYQKGLLLIVTDKYNEALYIFNTILDYKDSNVKIEFIKNKLIELDSIYKKAKDCAQKYDYTKSITLLESIAYYLDSVNLINEYILLIKKENKYQSALNMFNNNEYQEALTLFNTINDYRDSNKYINQCNELIQKEEKYQSALLLINSNDNKDIKKAYELLLTIKDYKDSNESINKLNEIIKKNHKKKINFSISIITGFLVISLLLIFLVFIPNYKNKQYNSGIDLLTNGNYEEAIKILDGLDYKESNKYYNIALASKAFEDDDYEKGINTLTSIGISSTINYDNSDCDVSITSEEVNSINDITCIASKEGYKFINWNYESYQIDVKSNIYTLILKPIFNSITYFITYDLDGGTAENENDYTIEEEVKLTNPTKTGYTFTGWTGTDLTEPTLNVTISEGSVGDRTYKANYTINSYTITFDTDGGSTINSITQEYGTSITAPSNPTKTDYIFTGWDTTIPTTMPASNLTIKAEWKYIYAPYEENGKMYINLGSFPQTHVSDTTLINSLNALTATNANGYYEYEGCEYCKVTASPCETTYTYSDGTNVTSGIAWFKVEPIKWRVLYTSNNEYTLLSEYLLIAKRFDDDSNDYLTSEIRTYLTGDFYSKAFITKEKAFIQNNTNVNNDKVWLLSKEEVCNTTYGFNSDATSDTNRKAKLTDYALAIGAYFYRSNGAGDWWLRTPDSSYSSDEYRVYYNGNANYYIYVSSTYLCARPAIIIKLDE